MFVIILSSFWVSPLPLEPLQQVYFTQRPKSSTFYILSHLSDWYQGEEDLSYHEPTHPTLSNCPNFLNFEPNRKIFHTWAQSLYFFPLEFATKGEYMLGTEIQNLSVETHKIYKITR